MCKGTPMAVRADWRVSARGKLWWCQRITPDVQEVHRPAAGDPHWYCEGSLQGLPVMAIPGASGGLRGCNEPGMRVRGGSNGGASESLTACGMGTLGLPDMR